MMSTPRTTRSSSDELSPAEAIREAEALIEPYLPRVRFSREARRSLRYIRGSLTGVRELGGEILPDGSRMIVLRHAGLGLAFRVRSSPDRWFTLIEAADEPTRWEDWTEDRAEAKRMAERMREQDEHLLTAFLWQSDP